MSAESQLPLVRAVDAVADAGLAESHLTSVVRSVRRRRIRRHTVESVVGVAAAGFIGTAVWGPAARARSATRDTAGPVDADRHADPDRHTDPSSVPHRPAPAGDLRAAPFDAGDGRDPHVGDGGLVAPLHIPIYTMESGAEQQTVTTRSLYLLSPTGTRYKLLDLPENPLIVNQLTHWKAGEIRALVSTFHQDGDNDYAWLDLRNGERKHPPEHPADAYGWVGVTATGSMVWQGTGTFYVVAPDGTSTSHAVTLSRRAETSMDPTRNYLVGDVGILNLETGRGAFVLADADTCFVAGWLDDTHPAVSCGVLMDPVPGRSIAGRLTLPPRPSAWDNRCSTTPT